MAYKHAPVGCVHTQSRGWLLALCHPGHWGGGGSATCDTQGYHLTRGKGHRLWCCIRQATPGYWASLTRTSYSRMSHTEVLSDTLAQRHSQHCKLATEVVAGLCHPSTYTCSGKRRCLFSLAPWLFPKYVTLIKRHLYSGCSRPSSSAGNCGRSDRYRTEIKL